MIKIDKREPAKIFKYAEELGLDFEAVEIPIGDIVCDEKSVCIERKEYADLVNSIKSGHLYKQLLQMEENYKYCFLLISGKAEDLHWQKIQWSANQNAGALASLAVRFPKVKMVFLPNDKQLVYCAKGIIDRVDDGKGITIRDTELLKSKLSDEDFRIRLLCSFSNIGRKRAEEFLQNENVCNAINNFLTCLETCGVKKMENIVKKHKKGVEK